MKLQKGNGTPTLTSCSRVAKALVYQPSGPGSIPGMFRLRCQLPPVVPFELQSRLLIPGPQEVDVAAGLPQSCVAAKPSMAGAGVTAATALTHVEAGGVTDDGAETIEPR